MTGAILQSDIDFAKRSLKEGRSEEEVLIALNRRGIDILKSMRLIEDLLEGRTVVPELMQGEDFLPRKLPEQEAQGPSAPGELVPVAGAGPERTTHKTVKWLLLAIVLALVAAGIFIGLAYNR